MPKPDEGLRREEQIAAGALKKAFAPEERDHPFLTGGFKQSDPMEPEVWMLDHPVHKKFKIAIKWLGAKDDKDFVQHVLDYCLNGPLFGTRQDVNGHRFEHRIFRSNNWYVTEQWLDHKEKNTVAKAFDESGITLGCWPAEKDPEKAFVCGLKDNDLKFFPYKMKEKDNPVGIVPGSAFLLESDLEPMPELPKLSDVEKEYAKQEAADSLLKAVYPEEPESREDMLDLLAWYDRHDGFDHVSDRTKKSDEELKQELVKRKERYWNEFPIKEGLDRKKHPEKGLAWTYGESYAEKIRREHPALTNDPASQAELNDHLRREAAEAEMVENTKHIEALSGEKLKHCPYCGTPGKASVFSMNHGYFSVLCLTCDARGPKALRMAEAIEKWNNRNFTGG